ncbi:hypothetical protein HYPSUDRAFT_208628 [Hypholoma sublateritium FD-334 SS-4]|uniref:Uncharacterized protein n=1 Tax=Hypholoma sublateritium (strain FD-334 SS-4) TaxID=945553 RepID=A0A0D2P1P9_HYPSF|nr:hypothetical protein HYPSUDRAFT_208628 [Hypholoma sublateritium FD-334 SS-4]
MQPAQHVAQAHGAHPTHRPPRTRMRTRSTLLHAHAPAAPSTAGPPRPRNQTGPLPRASRLFLVAGDLPFGAGSAQPPLRVGPTLLFIAYNGLFSAMPAAHMELARLYGALVFPLPLPSAPSAPAFPAVVAPADETHAAVLGAVPHARTIRSVPSLHRVGPPGARGAFVILSCALPSSLPLYSARIGYGDGAGNGARRMDAGLLLAPRMRDPLTEKSATDGFRRDCNTQPLFAQYLRSQPQRPQVSHSRLYAMFILARGVDAPSSE